MIQVFNIYGRSMYIVVSNGLMYFDHRFRDIEYYQGADFRPRYFKKIFSAKHNETIKFARYKYD